MDPEFGDSDQIGRPVSLVCLPPIALELRPSPLHFRLFGILEPTQPLYSKLKILYQVNFSLEPLGLLSFDYCKVKVHLDHLKQALEEVWQKLDEDPSSAVRQEPAFLDSSSLL